MTPFEDCLQAIKSGELVVPEDIAALPREKLQEIIEPLYKYLSNYHVAERSPRLEILRFVTLVVEEMEFQVFIVNLSLTGALLTVNSKTQSFDTNCNGKISLYGEKLTQLAGKSKLELEVEFVREEKHRDALVFVGCNFVNLSEEDVQTLSTILFRLQNNTQDFYTGG